MSGHQIPVLKNLGRIVMHLKDLRGAAIRLPDMVLA
jgi:hypothetical protein